jgi:hypothetical protein
MSLQRAKPAIVCCRWRVWRSRATFQGKNDVRADRRAAAPAGGADGRRPRAGQGLAPLLAGRFGADARDLVLCCLSRRLAAGWSIDVAPLLALTDATQIAARQYEGAE